jgi:hypothetical protein
MSSSGSFGITNIKYRVGAPPLRPLPVWRVILVDDRFEGLEALAFREKAKEVSAANGLDGDDKDVDIDISGRMVPGQPWTTQPTVVIAMPWRDNSREVWEQIVIQLKRYVDERAAPLGFDVAIEIIAPELFQRKYISPILDDQSLGKLSADWPAIKNRVVDILDLFPATASHMNLISLFRLGYEPDSEQNPKTIYVSFDYQSDQLAWPSVIQRIQDYLDGLGHGLHVHMEHNVLKHFAFPLVPPQYRKDEEREMGPKFNLQMYTRYQTTVGPGADIGAACYITRDDGQQVSPLHGTFGCYLEIQQEGIPGWTKVGLTNYHVVRPALSGYQVKKQETPSGPRTVQEPPANGSALWQADREGFDRQGVGGREGAPDRQGVENCALIEHPSRARHNYNVDELQKGIARRSPLPGMQAQMEEDIAFFDQDSNLFGQVWAGSGYRRRTASNGRLDWALIKPLSEERVQDNLLPDEEQYYGKVLPADMPAASALGTPLKPPPDGTPGRGLDRLKPGDNVYKMGANTGISLGLFDGFKPDCKIHDERQTGLDNLLSTEYMFIGRPDHNPDDDRFADVGDSGAVVFDEQGRALGMLFTGQSPQQCGRGMCLVTPIEEIFEDIKALCKDVTAVRIAVPQPGEGGS